MRTIDGASAGRLLRSRRTILAIAGVLVVIVAVAAVIIGKSRSVPAAAPPAPSPSTAPTAAPAALNPLPCVTPASLLAMPLRDKLAQLLMVGVKDAADARAVVQNQHIGGIMIGSWTDLTMMGDPLKQISDSSGPLPLSVSVDEEGGRVERLASKIGEQDSPRVLAQTRTPEQVHQTALTRGLAMKQLGITVDFAPVVDVTTERDDEVIGDRSFGSNPETVIKFAGAYAQGLRDAGVLPVLKHFPGHGHGSGDSHKGEVSTPPLDQLKADDLIPYQTLTTTPPVAVMVGHLQVPDLTGVDPTSLSPAAYRLLRDGTYGGPPFTGLIYTDDLSSMGAINQRYGLADAVLKALQAGADVALWITTDQIPAVLDHLVEAVNDHILNQNVVDDALQHVANAKGPKPGCAS